TSKSNCIKSSSSIASAFTGADLSFIMNGKNVIGCTCEQHCGIVCSLKGVKTDMEPHFFTRFYPQIISVQKREPSYWHEKKYAVFIKAAKIRNFFYIFDGIGHVELNGTRILLS